MSSAVDADLLVYAHNASASQHAKAKSFVEERMLAAAEDEEFVIAHQTLFELFAALSNPIILPRPLSSSEAWKVCRIYREHPKVQTIAYDAPVLEIVGSLLEEQPKHGKRLFDLVLAATLKYNGVTKLYTHNVKHFSGYRFLTVENPLSG